MSSQTLENMLAYTNKPEQEKKPRPAAEQAQKCPRCDSTNTKFCYYNNYSLTQPRYFCKSCRRYWTKGGTLRNVPVGGGCRKNKRTTSKKSQLDHESIANSTNYPLSSFTPLSCYDSSDLSLAFAKLQKQASGNLGIEENDMSMMCNNVYYDDFLGAQRGGFLELTSNGFHHNMYHGIGNDIGNLGQVENGEIMGLNVSAEMGMLYDQEMIFPWQINGEVNNMSDFEDSNRQNWNGFDSSFHGLNHSSLIA